MTDISGGIFPNGVWKTLRKVFPKNPAPVIQAKIYQNDKLITTPENIMQLTLNAVITRLRHRAVKPELKSLKTYKEFLCKLRLELSSTSVEPEFT